MRAARKEKNGEGAAAHPHVGGCAITGVMALTDRFIWALSGLILAGLLLSCTAMETEGRVWYKPGGTVEERDRLLAAARVQASQAHLTPTPGSPDLVDARRQTERQQVLATMTAAGWRLVPKAEAGKLEHTHATKPPQRALSSTLDR